MANASLTMRTLRWLEEFALTGAERRALRCLYALHVTHHTRIFHGCRTRREVFAVLDNGPLLLRQRGFGPGHLCHLQGLWTRVVAPLMAARRGIAHG